MTLQAFGPQIWIADGPVLTAAAGFRYPARMAVIRLAEGGLFVWSPTALSPDLRAGIDVLGPVDHIVAPNSLHDTFLTPWRDAYPDARLYAPPGLRARRPDLAFDADLADEAAEAWAGQIDQVQMRGAWITTEVVFFHRASRTAIFTDLIQHFSPGWFSGWRGLIARLDLMTGPVPAVPRKFRAAFTDRRAARAALRRIRAWPAEQVLMAHGTPVTSEGRQFIARAFDWLEPA